MPTEIKFEDMQSLNAALVARVAEALRGGLAARGQASLVVSGGRTPAAFLAALNEQELDWPRVCVTLADERWVAPDHADSNEALVRRYLLQNRAASAQFVALKNDALAAVAGVVACEAALRSTPKPFDVIVLGMGDDGHTASLFPQAPQLAAALDMMSSQSCIAIDPVTAPHARISLTLPALFNSRRIIVLINGVGKWQVYQRALQAGPVHEMPVRAVLHQSLVPVDVYWSP